MEQNKTTNTTRSATTVMAAATVVAVATVMTAVMITYSGPNEAVPPLVIVAPAVAAPTDVPQTLAMQTCQFLCDRLQAAEPFLCSPVALKALV